MEIANVLIHGEFGKTLLFGIPTLIITLGIIIPIYKKGEKRQKEQWKKELKAEQQEKQEFRQASKPLTQQSFEEWKAEKRKRDQGGFIDLDAEISLPWRRTT